MFSGFMVDASNIMRFEGVGNLSSNMEYSMEFWIFKPTTLSQQVILGNLNNIKFRKFFIFLYFFSFLFITYFVFIFFLSFIIIFPVWSAGLKPRRNSQPVLNNFRHGSNSPPIWVAQFLYLHKYWSQASKIIPQRSYSANSTVAWAWNWNWRPVQVHDIWLYWWGKVSRNIGWLWSLWKTFTRPRSFKVDALSEWGNKFILIIFSVNSNSTYC